MLAHDRLQVVVVLVATSLWGLHRILALAEYLLLAQLALAAFLLFPWGHHHILTWVQEGPRDLVGLCLQDRLWEDLADQWEVQVDQ